MARRAGARPGGCSRVRIAGEQRWIVVEDAARLRDALGVALPVGLAEAYLEPVADPLGDLVARYARTHGPFTAGGLRGPVRARASSWSSRPSRLGRHRPGGRRRVHPDERGAAREWCDAEVLRLLRRRSLAALRREIEPVPPGALAAFLPRWQQVGASGRAGWRRVAAAIEQLQGVAVPASAWERLVLPARVADYSPAYLDELCASGEVLWAGAGRDPRRRRLGRARLRRRRAAAAARRPTRR